MFGAGSIDSDSDASGSIASHVSNKLFSFSFLHWNINGIMSKLTDNDFISYVSSFDFVCLVETFVETLSVDVFPNHKLFCKSSVKLSDAGRPSGGVVCMIKNDYVPFVKEIRVDVGFFLLFIIDKYLFGLDRDMLYVCAYTPPEGSKYYSLCDSADGVSMLENCLIDNILLAKDCYILISGDLNARTSDIAQDDVDVNNLFDSLHKKESSTSRHSQDKVINSFGKSLLNMCTTLNLYILNGMCFGDLKGRYTYICDFGCSVIDYFLMSSDLFATVSDDCMLHVRDRTESYHMPVVLSVNFPENSVTCNHTDKVFIDKFTWKSEHELKFKTALNSELVKMKFETASQAIDINVNEATNMFNEALKEAADCMKVRMCINGRKKVQDWFDCECKNSRKRMRNLLKKFRRTLAEKVRFNFCQARREYKKLLIYKKKEHNKRMIGNLVDSVKDQKEFWAYVHKIIPKRKHVRNQITVEEWFGHFRMLLEKNITVESVDDIGDDACDDDLVFNRPISAEEILLALRKLKPNKASGPDGIIGELLKHSYDFILPFLIKFFNALFEKGIYPNSWTESIILPLHKKGDVNDPGNYRGISLTNVCSKVYGSIINQRLQSWVEENNLTGECQAGFKKGYSTVDHLFTLLACVQKQFSRTNNRKLYIAFIDFQKCFDTINRNLLWPILVKNGVKGKLFRCVRSMYESVKARVRCGARMTQPIFCSSGVKQGDACSPILFSLFINELALDVIRNGRHGITFPLDDFELFILLLADDVVLLSETVIGLQNQLNNLQRSAQLLDLTVNLGKSNIVVFRKGGYLGSKEKWVFDGQVMPVVNCYKYLGIFFTTKLSFAAACRDLASKAKKAVLCILQRLRLFNCDSLNVLLTLFDRQVLPIMQYGCEIWAFDNSAQYCEKVHLYVLKKYLGVSLCTPNDFVYNELNRYPITVNFLVQCIRYWLRLTQMSDDRVPKKAYTMLSDLDARGKATWVTNVRLCLFKFGFGFVWMEQGVGDINGFLRVFKQRMIDCKWQEWSEHVNESERFSMYRSFCNPLDTLPAYLCIELDKHLRHIMTKIRFGISELSVHYFRYRYHRHRDLFCKLCSSSSVENEVHFFLYCPFYEDLRKRFIAPKFHRNPNAFRLSLLLSSRNSKTIRKLCIFTYQALKRRDTALL